MALIAELAKRKPRREPKTEPYRDPCRTYPFRSQCSNCATGIDWCLGCPGTPEFVPPGAVQRASVPRKKKPPKPKRPAGITPEAWKCLLELGWA